MIGKTLSHYKVLEKIGQGGMGEVYRAEDTSLKREVAIKVLPEQCTKDPRSPDGRHIVFVALGEGVTQLYLRPMGARNSEGLRFASCR